MTSQSSFIPDFITQLETQPQTTAPWQNSDLPSYDFSDATNVGLVASSSTPQSFHLGTGASIFTNVLIPAITSATHEVIFVTCFWAQSKSLSALRNALANLAAHRRQLIRDARANNRPEIPPLRVRICLSSRSVFQKLFHPQSRNGYLYPPSSWVKDLGLPGPELLEAGAIELRVKSLFFLPFSVMHPKFVIIDRQRAFVPSCNVSWESWLEGCVEFTGEAVAGLVSFYALTWERSLDFRKPLAITGLEGRGFNIREASLTLVHSPAHQRVALPPFAMPLPTLVLPSSHHWNPKFRPFPWQKPPPAPRTPLNIAVSDLFDEARRTIYVQTPNLTCETVIAALLDAVQRGVDVTIVTNQNMMVLEQLVTAGTTTKWCIQSLVRRFQRLGTQARDSGELETGRSGFGRLRIMGFHSLSTSREVSEEPVHSHLKLTIVDEQYTVLGSGNMDRASWYTSQELGIFIDDAGFAQHVKRGVESALEGRVDVVLDSGAAQ
ncbi:phospholipase D p2 [Podospora aff. communis PSN243]|uniref:Phospholipase D p2 n=1 Tax=Podospora aff. communis PSN243 TaxID=3040156 RepID=A0AAV9G8B7_9PEZI|nr:phospholipase D p2 [Podospora aff. communis PSN243]